MIIGAFEGSLAHFNMWDEFISHSRITDLACSSFVQGNVVAWPEVQFWRVGHVTTKNISSWKMSGENLNKANFDMIADTGWPTNAVVTKTPEVSNCHMPGKQGFIQ